MKFLLKINRHKPRINLCSSHLISTKCSTCFKIHTHKKTPINHTTNRTSTQHNNHTRMEGVVETSEEEVEEEDLVEEEAKLHDITVEN